MTRALQTLFAAAILTLGIGCGTDAPGRGSPAGTAGGWELELDGSGSAPVVADGVLYIGAADGAVYAVDAGTGAIRWRFQTGEHLSSSNIITLKPGVSLFEQVEARKKQGFRRVDMAPAIDGATVFVGSGDLSFYAIDAATGSARWSYLAGPGMHSTTGYPIPPALVTGGHVYFATENGLHALDARTGTRLWLFEVLQELRAEVRREPQGPASDGATLFVTAWPIMQFDAPYESFVYAVDSASGKARWSTRVPGIDVTDPVTAQDLVLFAVDERASLLDESDRVTLYALDGKDGRVKWKLGGHNGHATPRCLPAGGAIYFATSTALSALDPQTGRPLWSYGADELDTSIHADDQRIYLATAKDRALGRSYTLHALSLANGQEAWSQSVDGAVAAIADGVLYTQGEDVYALDAATGKKQWSSDTSGRESVRSVQGGKLFLTSSTVTFVGSSRVEQGYLRAIDAKTGR